MIKRILVSIVLLLTFTSGILVLVTADTAAAPEIERPVRTLAAADPPTEPVPVRVGVYVLNIGKLDTATGSFTADFYLTFSSDTPSTPGNFEFSNGRATSTDKSYDEPTEKGYRIQASLADNLNLSRYPFDSHNLTIELEDKDQTVRTQVYQVSRGESGLDPAVRVAGWELDGWDARVEDHVYDIYETTFSRYVFDVKIHRSVTAAILKTILPALTIVTVGLLGLFLAPDKIVPRLTLSTGALTSAVLFHINMTSALPPLSYLTLGDRFMLLNYMALTLAIISTLIAIYYSDKKQAANADRVHKLALVIVPAVWIAAQAVNFIVP